jgi:hypothetical protein
MDFRNRSIGNLEEDDRNSELENSRSFLSRPNLSRRRNDENASV